MTLTTDTEPTFESQEPDEVDASLETATASTKRKVSRARRFFMRPRRLFVRLHRWLSFLLLAWVAVIAITGFWLVFSDAYDSKLRPALYESSEGDLGMQAAIDSVIADIPEDGYVPWMVMPVNGRGVYQIDAAWADPDAPTPATEDEFPEEIYVTYYVDPGTAEINGVRDSEEGFTWWMWRGHMYLWQDWGPFNVFHPDSGWCRVGADAHEPGGAQGVVCDVIPDGMDLVGWFGVGWIVVLLSGFYLWYWPGVRRWATAFAIRRGRGSFAFNLSVHKVVGFVVWTPLVVIAWTGIMFSFPNLLGWYENVTPAGRGFEMWVPEEDPVSTPIEGVEPMDADEFIAAFDERYPDRTLHTILGVPADETGTWQAWVDRGYSVWTREGGAGNTLVIMDQFSGEVIYDGSPEDGNVFEQAWQDWGFPLHTGDWGGPVTRFLWTLVAISPVALGATGTIMWFIRRGKRNAAAARAESRTSESDVIDVREPEPAVRIRAADH